MKATIYSDGGSRPTNPGHSGFAAIIKADQEYIISRYIGWHSNNVAEYHGLITGAKYALQLGVTEASFRVDSELIVKQISGEYKVRNDGLKVFFNEAMQLFTKFQHTDIKWIPRKDNKQADQLCTEAILAGMHRNPFYKQTKAYSEIDPFNGLATMNIMLSQHTLHISKHANILIHAINKRALH